MAAPAETLAPMSVPDSPGSLLPGEIDVGLTVEEFLVLVESGTFGPDRRMFLWEGRVCEKMSKTLPHSVAACQVLHALFGVLPKGWIVWSEGPVRIGPTSLPLPDLALLRGPARQYTKGRFPDYETVGLMIEVSVSSLSRDLGPRAVAFARAGVVVYWVVDALAGRVVEHRGPGPDGYATVRVLGAGDILTIPLDGVEVGPILVEDLLP